MPERNSFFFTTARHSAGRCWAPALDVYRCDRGWLIKCDLAGVHREDIQVRVAGRELTILGHRRDWSIDEGFQAWTLEIAYCQFERTVELPCDLEASEISTDYRDGMLLISIAAER